MKILVLVLIACSLPICFAKSYHYSSEADITKDSDTIAKIIMDRKSYCDKCKYRVANLKESTVVETMAPKKVYIHNRIEKMGDHSNFAIVEWKEITPDKSTITINYPSPEEASRLRKLSGKNHAPVFTKLDVTWHLTKKSGGITHVKYDVMVEADNPILKMGWGKVKKRVRATAKRMIEIVSH